MINGVPSRSEELRLTGEGGTLPPASAPAGGTPSVWQELKQIGGDLVRYRELLAELTRRDLRIRYKQAVMGIAWAVLMPLVVALSGWVIRLAVSYLAGSPLVKAELAGVAVKALAWSFFVGALGFGTASITANLPLVTKVYFPREVLPLSAVATQIVDTAIGAAVLGLALPLFGVYPSRAILWLPLLGVLLVLLTTGLTLLAACANVFFRDARHLVQIIVSFGIFFTPVFFNADTFGRRGVSYLMGNPLGPVLEGLRLALVERHDLLVPIVGAGGVLAWSPWFLLWSGAWAVLGTAAAAVIFHRAEFAFAEYV
jgi:ABC-type polysaccharide/polyol phosphate export permease